LETIPHPSPRKGSVRESLQDFINGFVHRGISDRSFEEQKFIKRYNQFFLCCILFFISGFLFKFFNGLYLSSFVCLGSFALALANYFILHRNNQRWHLAKYVLLALVNLAIVSLSYVEGLLSGTYVFLFPFIVSQTFILNYEEKTAFRLSIVISVISIALVFVISPSISNSQFLASNNYRSLFYMNSFIAFIISCLFAYLVIKENKKNELGLVQERIFLDTIYNTSLDAVFIIDCKSLKIHDCNRQAIELFGASDKTELLNTSIETWMIDQYNGESLPEILTQDTRETWKGEIQCVTKKETRFVGSVFIAPFTNKEIEFRKISIIDITDYKKAEMALIEAKEKAEEAALSKARFVSNMSHELRTPLNGIIGTTNLLLQDEIFPHQQEHFDILKFSSEHMLDLINDVLDVNKIDAGKFELEKRPWNIKIFAEKIEAIFHNQFAAKNIDFQVKVDHTLDRKLIFDATRLGQVMNNLLANALKFTHRGNVIFEIRNLSSTSDAVMVGFSVKDSGIGIEAQKLPHIFERFYQADVMTTRKYGGSGLGLSISKKLVELFNGELKVESEVYKGSRFFFTLTLQNYIEKKPLLEDNIVQVPLFSSAKVLIAEDNPVNLMIARKFLQKWNLDISEAHDGVQAIEIFNQKKFDILLLDLEMPEKDGYSVLEEVRRINPTIPVIAFTAASFENMGFLLREKGFNDYVQKPFKPEELHSKIMKFLQRNNAA